MTHIPAIDDACDTAQQVVTAILHDDRAIANRLIAANPHPAVLAFVLADLVATVHAWWATQAGHVRPLMLQDWVDFLADLEQRRTRQ